MRAKVSTAIERIKTAISFLAPRRAKARLLRSVLGKKINEPHKALKKFERVSADATLWIFLGIMLETGVVIWFVRDWRESLLTVVANGLIGFGLIREYVVILRARIATATIKRDADRKVAEAALEAARANERAAELEKEVATAKLRLQALQTHAEPRVVNVAALGKLLEGVSPVTVEILVPETD